MDVWTDSFLPQLVVVAKPDPTEVKIMLTIRQTDRHRDRHRDRQRERERERERERRGERERGERS